MDIRLHGGDYHLEGFFARGQEIYFGRFFTLGELIHSIEEVTIDDVQGIAAEFFHQKQIALTVLGNLNGFKLGREKLVC